MHKISKYKKDIFLIAAIFIVGLIILLILLFSEKQGKRVQVRVDGEVIKEFDLSTDTQYEIEGSGGTNLLLIKDGKACVTKASCPDGLCMKTGRIDKEGQSIVCLPNKVVVEIVSDKEGSTDMIAG